MKDIVIIANFCRDFSISDNGRFMYLAKELAKNNKVEIITSDFSHGQKKHKSPLTIKWPFSITFLHEPGYKKNICLKRFYSHFIWGKNVYQYLKKRSKPEVVYCAIPSLTGPLLAAKYCQKNNVRFIIDIQDLWPEAFKMVFNIPIICDIIFKPFEVIANGIYKRADVVCGVSSTYIERALQVNRKCKHGHAVYLGTKLSVFDENANQNPVEKREDELWLGYCGTLGASYDLTCVFDALVLLKERGVNVPKFVIMGDGPRREEFEIYAKDRDINAVFTGRLPYDQMCGRLCACDIVVNPIVAKSAASIINKHSDYAASGLPVINTQESLEYIHLVEKYNMGFNCKNGDAEDMAGRLKQLIEDKELREMMGENARKCAEERFDRHNSYRELICQISDKLC